jgi:hypothetical protein
VKRFIAVVGVVAVVFFIYYYLGKASAYDTDCRANLLNTSAAFTSPFHDGISGFYRWISGRKNVWQCVMGSPPVQIVP